MQTVGAEAPHGNAPLSPSDEVLVTAIGLLEIGKADQARRVIFDVMKPVPAALRDPFVTAGYLELYRGRPSLAVRHFKAALGARS